MQNSYLLSNEKTSKQRISIFDNLADAKKLLTVNELGRLIGISPRTIYNWIHRESSFPYIKMGRPVRFEFEKVLLWLENRS